MHQAMIQLLILLLIVLATICTSENLNLTLIKIGCERKFDFKSIDEFKKFVHEFRRLEQSSVDNLESHVNDCLQREKEPLYDLDELITHYDKTRPCKFREIEKLEQYAKKYFASKNRPSSLKFFTLFGVNIGLRCLSNLLAHIKQADMEADQLDFIYSMASPTGWTVLINEHTKKSMKFGSSSTGNEVPNRIAKLIPGLVLVDQLDYMNFNHLKNNVQIENWQGIEEHHHEFQDPDVALKMAEFLERIVESCQNLDQFYVNSLLSLARLNELGLLVSNDQLNGHHERSVMLHKWLAAASFCQLMIRVRVGKKDGDNSIGIEILHDDSLLESRRKLYSYVAQFDEISQEAVNKVWLASVPEGQWLQKNHAMFRSKEGGKDSSAMRQLNQFIRGLERDYQATLTNEAH